MLSLRSQEQVKEYLRSGTKSRCQKSCGLLVMTPYIRIRDTSGSTFIIGLFIQIIFFYNQYVAKLSSGVSSAINTVISFTLLYFLFYCGC